MRTQNRTWLAGTSRLFAVSIAAMLALASAGCGGGSMFALVESGGGDGGGEVPTPISASSAEFLGNRLLVHFEAPVTASISAEKTISTSNVSVKDAITGVDIPINTMKLSDDGLTLTIIANFTYMTGYRVATVGLTAADGSDLPDFEDTVYSGHNPDSLRMGMYADILAGLDGKGLIVAGPEFFPGPNDPKALMLNIQMQMWTYEDGNKDCVIAQAGFTMPQFLHMRDGHTFLLGRTCVVGEGQDELGNPVQITSTSFLLFDDMDAEPVAEFLPSFVPGTETDLVAAFEAGDFNGDGILDFAILEEVIPPEGDGGGELPPPPMFNLSKMGEIIENPSGLPYHVLRIFLGREDGFAGQIPVTNADVSIVIEGLWTRAIVMEGLAMMLRMPIPASILSYPSIAHGDFNGNGHSDIAVATVMLNPDGDPEPVVHMWLGSGERGVRDEPDIVFDGPFLTVAMGDVNGDGKDDLAVGHMHLMEIMAGVPEVPPGGVAVFLGSSSLKGVYTMADAGALIEQEMGPDLEEGYPGDLMAALPFSLLIDDFDVDGYADIAMGAPLSLELSEEGGSLGKIYLVHGRSDFGAEAADKELSAENADIIFRSNGEDTLALGIVLWKPGDMDNSGTRELIGAGIKLMGLTPYGNLITYQIDSDTEGAIEIEDAVSQTLIMIDLGG